MRDPGDRTALHNFRVAIRRLRSLLDAYRPWIGRAGGKKSRRRLRALTRMTGLSRDAEVQIEWLEKQRRDRKLGDHTGVDWLLRQVRARKRNNDRTARNQLGEDFDALAKSLRKRLGAVEDAEPSSFRVTFSDRLDVQADRFFRR